MFFTNKRLGKNTPTVIPIDNSQVKFVQNFKLLGVTIENKLNFEKNIAETYA